MRSKVGAAFAATMFVSLALVAPAHAAFPGANGKIAFVTDRDGNDEIYSMNADGSAQTRLTDEPNTDYEPSWSPDGRRIAFVSYRDGNGEIYVMKADGTGQTRITNNAVVDLSPAWSPDGRRIVFASDRDDAGASTCASQPPACHFRIYAMNADGAGVARLTNDPGNDSEPRWSPDATKIAFTRSTSGRNPDGTLRITSEIYTMSPDGSNQTSILSTTSSELRSVDWSPDSTRIAFESDGSIDSIGAGGSDPLTVASCYLNVSCGADVGLLRTPAWSPDGSKIAFSHRDCYFLRGFPCERPFIQTATPEGAGVATVGEGPNPRNGADDPDWQAVVGPQRSDYKNAAKFCTAERDFLGDPDFTKKYGGGANAYGKCVSSNH